MKDAYKETQKELKEFQEVMQEVQLDYCRTCDCYCACHPCKHTP